MTDAEIRAKAIAVAVSKTMALPDGDLDVYDEVDLDCDGGVRVTCSMWISNCELGIDEDEED